MRSGAATVLVLLMLAMGCGPAPHDANTARGGFLGNRISTGAWISIHGTDEQLTTTASGAVLRYPCYEAVGAPGEPFQRVCSSATVSEPIALVDGGSFEAVAVAQDQFMTRYRLAGFVNGKQMLLTIATLPASPQPPARLVLSLKN
jgi:hypothetical protein